jgi:hypothetical protein
MAKHEKAKVSTLKFLKRKIIIRRQTRNKTIKSRD